MTIRSSLESLNEMTKMNNKHVLLSLLFGMVRTVVTNPVRWYNDDLSHNVNDGLYVKYNGGVDKFAADDGNAFNRVSCEEIPFVPKSIGDCLDEHVLEKVSSENVFGDKWSASPYLICLKLVEHGPPPRKTNLPPCERRSSSPARKNDEWTETLNEDLTDSEGDTIEKSTYNDSTANEESSFFGDVKKTAGDIVDFVCDNWLALLFIGGIIGIVVYKSYNHCRKTKPPQDVFQTDDKYEEMAKHAETDSSATSASLNPHTIQDIGWNQTHRTQISHVVSVQQRWQMLLPVVSRTLLGQRITQAIGFPRMHQPRLV